jgi:Protein of unknown function (DUF938)
MAVSTQNSGSGNPSSGNPGLDNPGLENLGLDNPGSDERQFAAATERNRLPILDVLVQALPPQGTVLEISSGTGQHAVFFAPRLAGRYWLPSEPQSTLRRSILAWSKQMPCDRLLPPIALDVLEPIWPVEQASWANHQGLGAEVPPIQAIVNINMIHIAPWEATLALMHGAARVLPAGGVLYLYGPYQRGGGHTAASNAEFDGWLRSQNPTWGVRHLEAVVAVAEQTGFTWSGEPIAMPANNFSVVFAKA